MHGQLAEAGIGSKVFSQKGFDDLTPMPGRGGPRKARLAEMLGQERPDELREVQELHLFLTVSRGKAGRLAAISPELAQVSHGGELIIQDNRNDEFRGSRVAFADEGLPLFQGKSRHFPKIALDALGISGAFDLGAEVRGMNPLDGLRHPSLGVKRPATVEGLEAQIQAGEGQKSSQGIFVGLTSLCHCMVNST